MPNTLVIIPTYNEKENIERLISLIFSYKNDVDILIVDDNSPDGTAFIADKMASQDNRISVLHRRARRGRGRAGIEAFKEVLRKQEVDYVIEMDADFSHDPVYIPIFLKEIQNYDVVIGSRYVEGGRDCDRGITRILLSRLVNLFIRKYLKLQIKDCTSGYRCFRKKVLASLDFDNMISEEPSIFEEVLYNCKLKGYRIKEIPIVFKRRRAGRSKLGIIKLIKVFMDIINVRAVPMLYHRDRVLRDFGFKFALAMNILGMAVFYRGGLHFIYFTITGCCILIVAIIKPSSLRALKGAFEKIIFLFSRVISSLGLLLSFYLIFTPIALFLRLFRRDLLDRRINRMASSYWLKKENIPLSKKYYERMG